jgi:hypothetical protein
VQSPTLGRIVHYVMESGAVRPAIVVATFGDQAVNLRVFTDGSNDAGSLPDRGGEPVPETLWESSVPYSDEAMPKTWHWPALTPEHKAKG